MGAGITGGSLGPEPESALELPDQALELGHALAQGDVLGAELGDCGGRLAGAHLPPAGEAAPWQGLAADHAQIRREGGMYGRRRTARTGAIRSPVHLRESRALPGPCGVSTGV